MICHNSPSSFDTLICTLILNDLDITYNTLVANFFMLIFYLFMMKQFILTLEITHLGKIPKLEYVSKCLINVKSTNIDI